MYRPMCRAFKCKRMPYTDEERKEILKEIVKRQAYRILKVVLHSSDNNFSQLLNFPRETPSGTS